MLYAAVHCLAGAGFLFDFMARTEIRRELEFFSTSRTSIYSAVFRILTFSPPAPPPVRPDTERYHISGSPPADCCTAWCCIPCVQSQHSREIRREEELVRAEGRGHPHEPIAPAYGLGQPSPAPPQTTQAQVQPQLSQPMTTPAAV